MKPIQTLPVKRSHKSLPTPGQEPADRVVRLCYYTLIAFAVLAVAMAAYSGFTA